MGRMGRFKRSSSGGIEVDMDKLKQRRASAFIVPQDGGWGWVVCLASLWTNGTIFGIINSFGVMYERIYNEVDGADNFKTSWAASLCSGLTFMLSPVSSIITDRIGCRAAGIVGGTLALGGMIASSFVKRIELLYLTYGVMVGCGFSIAYTPSLVILGRYFRRRIGLANGIVTFGSGVFTIVLPLGLKSTLEIIGLANTLRVLAGLCCMMTLGAVVFRPVPLPANFDMKLLESLAESAPHGKPALKNLFGLLDLLDLRVWKKRNYRIWAIGVPVAVLGYFVPFVHLVKYVSNMNLGGNPAILITCIGATSGLARLIFGRIIDSPKVNRIYLQQIAFLVIGVTSTLLPVVRNFYALCVMMSFMGIFDGVFVLLIGPIAHDVAGTADASRALGFLFFMMSFPMTAGPPIAGFIYDKLQDYTLAFLLAGAPPIIGACILFFVRPGDHDDDNDINNDGHGSTADDMEQSRNLLNGSSDSEESWQTSPYARRKFLELRNGRSLPPTSAKPASNLSPRPILSTARTNGIPRNVSAPAMLGLECPTPVEDALETPPVMNGILPRSGRRVTYGDVVYHGEISELRPLPHRDRLFIEEWISVV
ncbi:monocarboxylate transporter 10-like [Acanthaster planci]|uniref:Monocarboxylate transporter 10-like n=1 Tax=Acanthaster planci TaxID=133434 RepID=A0A8B7XMI6_ACAPL|nr:monocarboxylate transporter 10-like [Acanthaster planci]